MQTAVEVAQVHDPVLANRVLQQRLLAMVGRASGAQRRVQRSFQPLSLEFQPFARGIEQVKLTQLAPGELCHGLGTLTQQRAAVGAL